MIDICQLYALEQPKDGRYAKNAGAVFNLSYHIVWCPRAFTRRGRSACAVLNVVWQAARRVHIVAAKLLFCYARFTSTSSTSQRPSAQTGSHAGEPVRKDWGKKTPARRTHICQGCPFRPLLVRRTVSDESDTKEGKNSAYLSLRNLLPQPLLPLAGLGREVLPEIR